MNKAQNPLQPPLDKLFFHLNLLNGLLYTLEAQLNNFRNLIDQISAERNPELSEIIGAGTSLVIRDLTEWPDNGWARYYPSGSFIKRGEEYLRTGLLLLQREAAWTVSQAYEAFETFLKDITAKYLLLNRHLADASKLKAFEQKKKKDLNPDDFIFWRNFIEYSYRKNQELLKFIRKIIPKLGEAELRNNRPINLQHWFSVAEEVRHAATHSNMVIKAGRMKRWSLNKIQILNEYFSGGQTNEDYQLKISREEAEKNLTLFLEYAFSIFKYLSTSKGYEWNILKKRNKN